MTPARVTALDLAPLIEAVAARVVELLDEREPASPAERATDGAYLTVAEVADRYRIAPKTVRDYVRRGQLPAVKAGRRWLIAADDVDRLAAARRVRPTPFPHAAAPAPRPRPSRRPMGAAVATLDGRRLDGRGGGA